jgi:hypothetical protein
MYGQQKQTLARLQPAFLPDRLKPVLLSYAACSGSTVLMWINAQDTLRSSSG